MFNAYEFYFAGELSTLYGVMLYDLGSNKQRDVSFGNQASIFEARTNNRIQPIHFGVNYHNNPLEFKLVFGAEHALDRYDLERISLWLTGHQDYQWLTICQPDLENVQFRSIITKLTPITHGWLPVAFEAEVRCDCPYAYSFPFERSYQISGSTNVLFRNKSSVREYLRPVTIFQPNSGVTEVKICNKSDQNRTFMLAGLPASNLKISVDHNSGIIQELNGGHNLYKGFNLNFFRLVHGDNELEITGDGVFIIGGRFLHNVAA